MSTENIADCSDNADGADRNLGENENIKYEVYNGDKKISLNSQPFIYDGENEFNKGLYLIPEKQPDSRYLIDEFATVL